LRGIVYAVVIFEVAKKCHAIIDVVHDYKVASAIAALYDMFTRAGRCHYTYWWQPGYGFSYSNNSLLRVSSHVLSKGGLSMH
jgi:hypothetical protein